MGDLRKKILHTDFEGKDSCTEIPGEENIFHVVRWKKNSHTVVCLEKKLYHQGFGKNEILTQTKSPIKKSNGQPLS